MAVEISIGLGVNIGTRVGRLHNIWRKSAVLAALVAALLLAPAAAPHAEVKAVGVRIGYYSTHTRLVVDLSERVNFRVLTLADPYRIVVEMPRIDWGFTRTFPLRKTSVISAFRFGAFTAETTRIVLDLRRPVELATAEVLPPTGSSRNYQLILDLKPTTRERYLAQAKRPTPPAPGKPPAAAQPPAAALPPAAARPGLPAPPGRKPKPPGARQQARVPPPERKPDRIPLRRRARRADEKPVVVIDPGHGGVDPGTIGRRGTEEKTVTLRMARALRRQLLATGHYKVVLTRNSDVFVELRKRIAIAREAEGDLFVSLHADSIKYRKFRGASVYTLSEKASDREAELLAKKENKSDIIAGIDLSAESGQVRNILIDLAQRETMNLSVHFAKYLVAELGKEGPLVGRTHRFAGFAVLKAPDVPSVLIELGYLSNPADERLLRQARHRAKVARAVRRAIDRYFAYKRKASRS
jgi:N-acetylmuramoyl-L-alanine amidase